MEYLSDYSVDLTVVYMDLSDEGVDGWCMREEDHEFIIQIDERLDGAEHTKTILHELYHIFQHLKNIPRCEMCANLSEEQNLDRYTKGL
jgi:Zn-dependent peptidase ImmA (M78 family)